MELKLITNDFNKLLCTKVLPINTLIVKLCNTMYIYLNYLNFLTVKKIYNVPTLRGWCRDGRDSIASLLRKLAFMITLEKYKVMRWHESKGNLFS